MARPEVMFHLELAERLGMTLDELYRKVSALEMTKWIARRNIQAAAAEKANPPSLDERARRLAEAM